MFIQRNAIDYIIFLLFNTCHWFNLYDYRMICSRSTLETMRGWQLECLVFHSLQWMSWSDKFFLLNLKENILFPQRQPQILVSGQTGRYLISECLVFSPLKKKKKNLTNPLVAPPAQITMIENTILFSFASQWFIFTIFVDWDFTGI